MATLAARLVALAQAIGADIKTLTNAQGSLSSLTTTQKGNLVGAINELKTLVDSASGGGSAINDTATSGTAVVYSVDKVLALIEAAKTEVKSDLVAGASTALDTFNEFAAALNNDPSFAATMATALGYRLRFDAAQTLTVTQQNTACGNLGIGNPDTDFVSSYTTAKA